MIKSYPKYPIEVFSLITASPAPRVEIDLKSRKNASKNVENPFGTAFGYAKFEKMKVEK